MTPLHWAAEYGHGDCVIQLLEHGADPSALNKFNKTADQIAFDNNFLEITRIIQVAYIILIVGSIDLFKDQNGL